MSENHPIIRRGLEEFSERLNARECWVTFETGGQGHWLQCARDQINMGWPFSHAPEAERLQEYFGALGPLEVVAWDSNLYATINLANTEIEGLTSAVDRVFRDLYGLGLDHVLVYKIEDA